MQHLHRPCNSSRRQHEGTTAPIRRVCLYCLTPPLGSHQHQRNSIFFLSQYNFIYRTFCAFILPLSASFPVIPTDARLRPVPTSRPLNPFATSTPSNNLDNHAHSPAMQAKWRDKSVVAWCQMCSKTLGVERACLLGDKRQAGCDACLRAYSSLTVNVCGDAAPCCARKRTRYSIAGRVQGVIGAKSFCTRTSCTRTIVLQHSSRVGRVQLA